jgi:predicted O-linked N-acetylglucosamine transferase (SPINDLY family)
LLAGQYPGSGFVWKVLGVSLQAQGKDALFALQKAAELLPDDAEVHSNLGVALLDLGQLDSAVISCRRALKINPAYAEAHYNLGVALQDLGQLDGAVASYRRALQVNPAYAEAHSNLGAALQALGQSDDAVASCRRALQINSDLAEAHSNLGNALQDIGQLDDAVASCRRALQINPDLAEAHSNLGAALQSLGQFDDAVASCRRALEINPAYAKAHSNLGVALQALGRLDDSVTSHFRALEINPAYAKAHNNLGVTLQALGRFDDAVGSHRRALELNPAYAEAHYNLGAALYVLGQFDDAVASCRRAVELKPDYVEAHSNLGNALQALGQPDDAEVSYRRALQVNPDHAQALYNLGTVLQVLGQFNAAAASCRRALELKPDFAEAHACLGNALQILGQLDAAMSSYRRALELKPDYVDAHSNLIFALDMSDTAGLTARHGEREKWNEAHAEPLWREPVHANDRAPARRLRVGYVSADFKNHSAARAFGGMLTRYDRAQFDVFAYSNFKGKADRTTDLFRQSVTVWRDIIGLTDESVAELIREDQIDILVDLSGFTAGNRLLVFARKPAPVQISAWGYASGTGMRAMDALFSDPVMVRPEERRYFAEEVRYLPSFMGAFFNDPFPGVNELPALSGGTLTFGSLNRLAKVSEQAYRAWAEVLLAVPGSRLLLKTGELDDASTRERVAGHFTRAGVAADRIIMLGKTSWHEHMRACNRIDLALDPFPQGGGVTALEGLMMGVPMVTLRWPTIVGRSSASALTVLGLTDWIAETREQYVELALQKAADLASLAELRRKLRGIFEASVIGDPAAYARAVEREYRQLWREWCANGSPQERPRPVEP